MAGSSACALCAPVAAAAARQQPFIDQGASQRRVVVVEAAEQLVDFRLGILDRVLEAACKVLQDDAPLGGADR
jgi:hypothetical protein